MESTGRLSVRRGFPVPFIIGIAAVATVVSLFLRWGDGGMYSLGPTLPWAYFLSSTFVGWILGSRRVIPRRNDVDWRSQMFATAYFSIGLASAVSLVLNVVLFYPDGVQRNVHTMFMNERALFTLLGPIIYLVPLSIALPGALLFVVRDVYKALTVGIFAVIVFTVALIATELSAGFLLLTLRLR